MTDLPEFTDRLCLVVDIPDHGSRTAPEQVDDQFRLLRIIQFACLRARIRRITGGSIPGGALRGGGGAQVVVLPPAVDPVRVVPALVLGLRHALYESNREPGAAGRIRLRAVLVGGSIGRGATGFLGPGVVLATDLAHTPVFETAFTRPEDEQVDLALVTSDPLYQDVLRQNYPGLPAEDFRPVPIAGRETTPPAWYHLPASRPAPDPRAARVSWPTLSDAVVIPGLLDLPRHPPPPPDRRLL
ncbi:hypothetical protein [Micromonospora sp. NBC_01796]|uniref:hypothetical protein n=1 Tax=Micromonospora sp. NBC_01796 TaxID=2975987 RepID=UPI002DDC60F9|nr:hypothetical protein [Micromonospora sp. NBC_01796]WSA87294.1 hypothetical protein OIE47_06665 [Micromonospora sp. NBC_01796]